MFVEQKLITSAAAFAKTVQGFVQCANSIMADTREVSKGDTLEVQQPIERNLKMIDYVLDKLKIVILQNEEYLSQQWDFLTGFWISFCSSKIIQVRVKTIAHIASITKALILEISQPEKDQQDRDQAKLERGEDSESQLES